MIPTALNSAQNSPMSINWANSLYAIGILSTPLCATEILHFPCVALFEIYTPLNAINISQLLDCS